MLARPIPHQGFEPVAGWRAQIIETLSVVEQTELSKRRRLNQERQAPTDFAAPDSLGLDAGKSKDHYVLYHVTVWGATMESH